MALYMCQVKNISRGEGRNAVAAAAYRSGQRLRNDREDRVADFSRRSGVVFAGIVAPEGAPDWASDRAELWNRVEASETKKNARVAKELVLALPYELTAEQRETLVLGYAEGLAGLGHVVDVAIHAPSKGGDERNHHAHLMITTRELDGDEFGEKFRSTPKKPRPYCIDATDWVEERRADWCQNVNAALEQAGRRERVDHRSNEAQGIERETQEHEGPLLTQLRRRGERPKSTFLQRVFDFNNRVRERVRSLFDHPPRDGLALAGAGGPAPAPEREAHPPRFSFLGGRPEADHPQREEPKREGRWSWMRGRETDTPNHDEERKRDRDRKRD